jgi:dephospho-CoA kinase
MMAARGAVVIDADVVAREVVEPGTDGLREVIQAFGDEVLGPDGTIDRAALARIVFADEEKRKRLETIVHPRVVQAMAVRLAGLRDTDSIVVLDVPLLVESSGSRTYTQKIVVVAASRETQLEHLKAKGMSTEDAEARMAAQAPLDEKLAAADYVIWNDGTVGELESRVEEVWQALRRDALAGAAS